MTSWVKKIEEKADYLLSEIAFLTAQSTRLNLDPKEACEPLIAKLKELYSQDYPLATTKDNSDLFLHIEGKGVEDDPRVSIVTSIFSNVRFQVRDLTKAIATIQVEEPLLPKHVDLELTGIARGSLFVGFKAPDEIFYKNERSIFGKDDPLLVATKAALKAINTVSHEVTDFDGITESEELSSIISDPKVRDASLVAVKRISPSNRSLIDTVSVTGRGDERRPADLTSETRRNLNKVLKKPVVSNERDTFVGRIREIDLDARRFELRGIADQQLQSIRCMYTKDHNFDPRRIIDANVRVSGLISRDASGRPRLLSVDDLDTI